MMCSQNDPAATSGKNRRCRLLIVVEGLNDIDFLRRISRLLHQFDVNLPNLASAEEKGEIVFFPFGGGHVGAWTHRLAALGLPEFHLYDHELPPETEFRRRAVEAIQRRPGCGAALTSKRSLENYLHPEAIRQASGVLIELDDFSDVAATAARRLYQSRGAERPWEFLPRRARSRFISRAKQWLNRLAAERMTIEMLRERGALDEIAGWLTAIAQLQASS